MCEILFSVGFIGKEKKTSRFNATTHQNLTQNVFNEWSGAFVLCLFVMHYANLMHCMCFLLLPHFRFSADAHITASRMLSRIFFCFTPCTLVFAFSIFKGAQVHRKGTALNSAHSIYYSPSLGFSIMLSDTFNGYSQPFKVRKINRAVTPISPTIRFPHAFLYPFIDPAIFVHVCWLLSQSHITLINWFFQSLNK